MRVRTAIPRQVLADRLRLLVEHGILRKEPYQPPGQRARHEYRPTDKGLALYPVVVAMAQWGDRYLADPEGPTPAVRAPRLRSQDRRGARLRPRPRGERPAPSDPPAGAWRASVLMSSCTHQGGSTHRHHTQTGAPDPELAALNPGL
jgi:hypothetical protein